MPSLAATLIEPEKIELVERPVPEPGTRELLVRVQCAGICGTDLALYRGTYRTDLPLVLGHEFCGVVEAVGEGAGEDWLGAFVTAEINVSCHSRRDPAPCVLCRKAKPRHCLKRGVLGIRGEPGAWANHVLIPVGNAHRLPTEFSPWIGALVEPVAAAIRTFELSEVQATDTVAVLGAGRLGLLVVRMARSHGARVIAFSRSEAKRALSLRFGAQHALEAGTPEARETLFALTEGLGADLVVECTGVPEGLAEAARLVRPGGVIALKSTCGEPLRDFSSTLIAVNEVRIQGSRCGPFPKAIERLKAGIVPVEDYVSGVFPLTEIESALAAAERATKILIEME